MAPIITDLIIIVLLCGVLILLWLRTGGAGGGGSGTRLELRLEEYLRRIDTLEGRLAELRLAQQEAGAALREALLQSFADLREDLQKKQGDATRSLAAALQEGMTQLQKQIGDSLARNSEELGRRMEALTERNDQRLREISGQVEKRLAEGFEKTTATFGDILKRLALIDEAQKKITELSSNVVSLQEVLADKRSRGAFGEVQLNGLISNVMPEGSYSLQYTLSNERICDCILFLPEPTGRVVIDAKFPLESYRTMSDIHADEGTRKQAERQFKQDIQKHIDDIAARYIIPGETSDGAVMFIPAEAVFAEIQAHHPDLVTRAHESRVWMVSPTTLWAILNTARAVLKDAATREQVHIIQQHLIHLARDFDRFQKRMDDLSRHIKQAHDDVDNVAKSARKITSRFEKIERVELGSDDTVTGGENTMDDPPKLS